MSSNNSETNGMAFGLALIGAGLMFFAIGVFIFFAVITAILSLLSLCALWSPLKLGKHVLQPSEARWFLARGIIGWFGLLILVIYSAPLFDIQIQEDWIIYIMMTGYMLGSLGGEWIILKLNEGDEVVLPPAMPAQNVSRMPPQVQQPAEPFQFATWDDEEER